MLLTSHRGATDAVYIPCCQRASCNASNAVHAEQAGPLTWTAAAMTVNTVVCCAAAASFSSPSSEVRRAD